MLTKLNRFYRHYGAGAFGLYRAFRLETDSRDKMRGFVPVTNLSDIRFDDLIGYEDAKRKLRDNTEAFLKGKKAANCLLYGDAGTGKSSSVKALLNEYWEEGLRIIEIKRHEFRHIEEVIEKVRDRNYKFLLYLDDLSFEEFETDYKYLNAVIEGGLALKPDNVLILATSNRRHLVRESFADRNDRDEDLHKSDTVEEKLSLAGRFGLTILYSSPGQKDYFAIVKELAKREGIALSEEDLYAEARRFELSHNGRSGRAARQVVDYLSTKQ
jgi:predicted AAA+ superfamily ATPase